ncbi:MAG: hypothetical protein ABIZ80_01285, partial [Bryobacteraceae bacterium]
MRIRIRITSETRVSRFRQVLIAAGKTQAYLQRLADAGLGTKREISRLRSVEDVLPRFPRMEFVGISLDANAFVNHAAPARVPIVLRSPLAGAPRTAILAPHYRESASVQVVTANLSERLRHFRPEVIAGPLNVLLDL